MTRNPFGDDPPDPPERVDPFGAEAGGDEVDAALRRLEHAARRVRNLRRQLTAEGLTASGSRELLEEVASAMDAVARAIRSLKSE